MAKIGIPSTQEEAMISRDEYVQKLKAARDAYRVFTVETLKLTGEEKGGRPEVR